MSFLLHQAGEHDSWLLGIFEEVILHGLKDTLKILPFLFLTYLFMEWIEHKNGEKIIGLLRASGKKSTLLGALLGAVPQCGFGATGAGLFSAGILKSGTLIAIFLSTSDEMLPVLISGSIPPLTIALLLAYKIAVALIVGLSVDFVLKLLNKKEEEKHIHKLCQEENCHCENGIWLSAIHHTLKIFGFLLLVTLIINTAVYFVGDEVLKNSVFSLPFVSHLLSALLGLVPNCAVSVALADFYVEGFITAGTMLSGLFSSAGVGLLVLFRTNKNLKQNLIIASFLALVGLVFGMIFDLISII